MARVHTTSGTTKRRHAGSVASAGARGQLSVVIRAGNWVVVRHASDGRILSTHSSQKDAVDAARRYALSGGTKVPSKHARTRDTAGKKTGSVEVVVAEHAPNQRRSVEPTAFEPSARARALLRGAEIAAKDLADAGGAYTLEQVQVLLNDVSRQSVDKKIKAGELLAVPGPSNVRHYPVIQFNDDRTVVAGLKEVQAALPGKTGWAVLNFLIHPDLRLSGQRPIDLLRRGKIAEVVAAAKLVGEPGA